MAQNDEYNSLVSRKNSKIAEKKSRQNTVNGINAKLNRLYPVKRVLSEQKSKFKTIKKQSKKCIEDDYEWTGSTHDAFIGRGAELNAENEYFLNHQLDRLLDELNNEITALENERSNQYGIIGRLASEINSLANAIENFLN